MFLDNNYLNLKLFSNYLIFYLLKIIIVFYKILKITQKNINSNFLFKKIKIFFLKRKKKEKKKIDE